MRTSFRASCRPRLDAVVGLYRILPLSKAEQPRMTMMMMMERRARWLNEARRLLRRERLAASRGEDGCVVCEGRHTFWAEGGEGEAEARWFSG